MLHVIPHDQSASPSSGRTSRFFYITMSAHSGAAHPTGYTTERFRLRRGCPSRAGRFGNAAIVRLGLRRWQSRAVQTRQQRQRNITSVRGSMTAVPVNPAVMNEDGTSVIVMAEESTTARIKREFAKSARLLRHSWEPDHFVAPQDSSAIFGGRVGSGCFGCRSWNAMCRCRRSWLRASRR